MSKNITTKVTIQNLAAQIKKDFVKKSAFTPVQQAAAAAFKSGKVDGNTVSLYTSTDQTGTAAFSFDFPTEYFLDQAKSVFVQTFAWSETAYPGSTNPNLDGKPVMVLAVKGDNNTVQYSFVDLTYLLDTYTGGNTSTAKVTVDGKEITVAVNVSKATDNALQVKEDGLFVPKAEVVDISGKADKVADATEGNSAGLDANCNLTDSGKKASDFVSAEAGKRLMTDAEGEKLGGIAEGATKVEASVTNGNIKVNGEEKTVYTLPETVLHGSDISDYTAEEIAALLADDEG